MAKITQKTAMAIAKEWIAEGFDVVFYPTGLTSKSHQYRPPVLVGVKGDLVRQVHRSGHVTEMEVAK